MAVSEATFERVLLEDPKGLWELHRGRLWEKPPMSWHHLNAITELVVMLHGQLNRDEYRVHTNGDRVRRSASSYYLPDVVVVPAHLIEPRGPRAGRPLLVAEPLPLVAEVWSPSTGDSDVVSKVPEYEARGDREIWLLHPDERTLTIWWWRPDGGYDEHLYRGGVVAVESLPGVRIDLVAQFDA